MTIPLVWPKAGASVSGLATALRDARNTANNVPMPLEDELTSYINWSVNSAAALQSWLEPADVDRLIRTPTFWAALGLPSSTPGAVRLVNEEMMARRQELQRTVDSLEAAARHLTSFGDEPVLAVPDTNVLMAFGRKNLVTDWHHILTEHVLPLTPVRLVIPLLTVDELEKIKSGTNERRRAQAQHALKFIHRMFAAGPQRRPTVAPETAERGSTTIELLMESARHVRLPRADDELVDTVTRLSSFTDYRVVLVTFDFGADLRAAFQDLDHVHLPQQTIESEAPQ